MEEKEEKAKVKKTDIKNSFELVEVPTQTAIVFRDETGNVFEDKQAILQILNDLALLKKALL